MMAALMRSVLRCSRLRAVHVPGNTQVIRGVRALRRSPVRVIYPDRESKVQLQDRGALAQQKSQPQDKGALAQQKSQPKDRGALAQQKSQPQDRGALTQQKRKPQDRGALTQPKSQPQEWGPLAQQKVQAKERGPLTQKDKRVYQVQQPVNKDRADDQDFPQPLDLRYDKARPGDNRLGKVVSIAKSKSFRDRHGQVLLEGRRLLLDALEAGAVLHTLFFNRVDQLKELPADKLQKANLVKVKFEDISLWSDLVTPQGIMGIFRKPDHVNMNYPETQLKNMLPLTLICDNIRDPGNLGTILRSAAGAGCNKVLLTKGCVDAWEPKVIRGGMGAHFRLPIITSLDWDTIENYLCEDTKVFVADNFWQNVTDEEEFTSGKAIDYGWISNDPKKVSYIEGEDYYTSSDEEDEELQDIPKVSIQHYHQGWAKGPSALVIGGETHGLSIESLLLVKDSGGRRLYIPVVPGIESLNSAMAASILLFEGRRQLQMKSS
ncbi:rRNA methyltransferase 3, mitochondrial [Mantella aurantiaca]